MAVDLLPCIVQDARTGEVLTLAYMNDEAQRRTRETGEIWFWSRSRQELWHKGETSGNTMRLHSLRYDCDEDALLALVEPAGPACHTGERTCFHKGELDPVPAEALAVLERTIAERRCAIVRSSDASASDAAGSMSPRWKQVRSPVWQAGPAGSTSASRASSSQS